MHRKTKRKRLSAGDPCIPCALLEKPFEGSPPWDHFISVKAQFHKACKHKIWLSIDKSCLAGTGWQPKCHKVHIVPTGTPLKKVVFSLLYPYDIQRQSCIKNQVHMRKLTYARSPIVCVTGSTFEVPSFELLLFFLHAIGKDEVKLPTVVHAYLFLFPILIYLIFNVCFNFLF